MQPIKRFASLLMIFYSVVYTTGAGAALRVYKLRFSGDNYYVLALHPMREEPFILNYSRLPDLRNANYERGSGLLSVRLSDGSAHDQGHAAVEFLTFDGPSLALSPDFLPLSEEQKDRIRRAPVAYEVVRVIENHLRQSVENWAFRQYLGRDRIKDPNLLNALQSENHSEGDGMGWIVVMNNEKRVIATLSMAARTGRAPELPDEKRAGENFGDVDIERVEGYPILKDGKIQKLESPELVGITMALKRFIIDKEVPIDLMPVLFYFAEKSTMTWKGPLTRAPILHRGRPVPEYPRVLVSRYVMSADRFMAVVNQRPPYRFKLLKQNGDDFFLHATREQFLSVWETERKNPDSTKINGKTFLSASEIEGGMVARGGYTGRQAIAGDYGHKSLQDLKQALTAPCESQLGN